MRPPILAVVEAGFFAAPQAGASVDVLEKYAADVLAWLDILDSEDYAARMSEAAAAALFDADLFPSIERLNTAIGGFRVFDANTIAAVIQRVLAATPTMESESGVHEHLSDPIITQPELLLHQASPSLRRDRERCLLMSLVVMRAEQRQAIACVLRGELLGRALVTFHLQEIEGPACTLAPCVLEGELGIAPAAESVAAAVGCERLWDVAASAADVSLVLSAYLRGRPASSPCRSFRFHGNFIATRPILTPAEVERTLSAMADAVLNERMEKVHALRINSGGGAPQRMRGLDKAQRRDVDYEYHLHYWTCADGSIEFVSVAVHNCFDISD